MAASRQCLATSLPSAAPEKTLGQKPRSSLHLAASINRYGTISCNQHSLHTAHPGIAVRCIYFQIWDIPSIYPST
jgi:hypothetical protein